MWSKTDVNLNYEICDTYPRDLYVPTTANNPSFLAASAKFRSRGRLPVYYSQTKTKNLLFHN